MQHYAFVRECLAWIASVACLFPVSIPLLYLAYRIREGGATVDDENRMENDELWKRSAIASAVLAAATLAFLFADVVLAKWAEVSAGIVHFVLFLLYFPAAAFIVMVVFAYDDYFAGLSQLTIFLAVPIAVLFVINALLGIWDPWLNIFRGWLKVVA